MGNFSNNAITDAGKMLLADVQAGAVFVATRIVLGSGNMPGGATAQSMTNVITPVTSIAIGKKKRTPDGKCIFGGVYTNKEVTAPFYFRELALYAKAVYLNEDGTVKTEGQETLYSYGNAGATADYMPAYSTSTVVEKQIDLVTWVGNDAQVDLTISSDIYVTNEEFEAHAARHAADGEDPITPADIGALSKDGDTVKGMLQFINNNDYFAIIKGRTIPNGKTHFLTMGVALDGGTVLEHYTCDTEMFDSNKRNGRLELSHVAIDGVINPDALILRGENSNNRAYRVYGEHNKPTAADVGAAPAGYGLGDGAALFDAKNIDNMKSSGWFYTSVANGYYIETVPIYYLNLRVDSWKGATGETLVVQTLHHETSQIRRTCKNGVWGLWEWENPPMVTGVEYRTTERYNNKAVFKKRDTNGNVLWKTWDDTSWHLLSSASYVSPATVE